MMFRMSQPQCSSAIPCRCRHRGGVAQRIGRILYDKRQLSAATESLSMGDFVKSDHQGLKETWVLVRRVVFSNRETLLDAWRTVEAAFYP